MALANTAWDDYSFGAVAPRRSRRFGFSAFLASAVIASVAFAGLVAMDQRQAAAPATDFPTAPMMTATSTESGTSQFARTPTAFERDAIGFFRDSVRLTTHRGWDSREVRNTGRFGTRAIASAPRFQPSFSLPVVAVVSPVTTEETAAPAMQLAPDAVSPPVADTPATAPVHISPTVVVPLPPLDLAASSGLVPATRLARQPDETVAIAAPTPPAIDRPTPLIGRIAPPASDLAIGRNDGVAIYDISTATVYMPNGERLEAHSGLGPWVDNPRFVDRRNVGPTPPNVYNLVLRKGRFHGVEALRLLPVNGNDKYGRVGLLAHTYLLRGRPAESNGCVAFKDYGRFLNAFKRGDVRRLLVVPSLSRA